MVLTLGIGATTAIFSVTHALVLRSLPVKGPASLTSVQIAATTQIGLTSAQWEQLARTQDALTDLFAYGEEELDAVLHGDTRHVTSAFVSASMFQSLGVEPVVGRAFDDISRNSAPGSTGLVIANAFWKREFGGDTGAIGQTLVVESQPFTIVGILPARFSGLTAGHSVDLYAPLGAERELCTSTSTR